MLSQLVVGGMFIQLQSRPKSGMFQLQNKKCVIDFNAKLFRDEELATTATWHKNLLILLLCNCNPTVAVLYDPNALLKA
jgi:hypothetical protein